MGRDCGSARRPTLTPADNYYNENSNCWKPALTCAPIQLLDGHEDPEVTARYLHLSQQHLHQVANPIEELKLSSIDQSRRLYHRPRP